MKFKFKKIFSAFLVCAFVFSSSIFAQVQNVETLYLSNSIPVYFKAMSENQIDAVYLVVKGGTVLMDKSESGLESALFEMMTRGSKKYSYEDIQAIEYRTQANLIHYSLYSGSILGLSCIDYYLDELLPVMLDGFFNPVYEKKQYDLLITEYNQKLQSIMNNPSSLLQYTLSNEVYKNHPLGTSTSVTPESLKNITVENMKRHHENLLDSKRISVVAVGKMNKKKLISMLEKSLGQLKPQEDIFPDTTTSPPLEISGDNVVLTHPAAKGTGFIMRAFPSAPVTSVDYVPSRIAEDMYTELLFNVVREKYGACYTPGSTIGSSPAPVGIDYIFRASDLENFSSYMKEAEKILESGRLISSVKDGVCTYDNMEDRLEGFINKYINQKYSNLQTTGGVASRLASSLLQFGDIYSADALAVRARSVTVQDIKRVFKKYWIDQKGRFFAVVGPESKDKIKF